MNDPRPGTVPDLWGAYGLTGNPFFQEELLPSRQTLHPVSLFVGRDRELALLGRQLGGGGSARSIVEGGAGVGKTSFVNRVKVALARRNVLAHDRAVRIEGHMTARGFAAEVLKVLLRLRSTHGVEGHGRFWQKIARVVEGEDVLSGGIAGVSVAQSRIPSEAPSVSLYDELGEALERLTGETAGHVLVHVNNLENLDRGGAAAAALLIRDLRDYFLLPGADWIFVGISGIERDVFGVYPQVAGIFPTAVVLEPLTPADVQELLERRYRHLQRGRRLVPPVEPETAATLYAAYHGDLRNFLRLLSDAAAVELGLTGITPLGEQAILNAMAPRRAASLLRKIGVTDFGHVTTLAGNGGDPGEFRVTDVAIRVKLSQGSASKLVDRLQRAGAVALSRTEGRNTYYHVTGDVLIAMRGGMSGRSVATHHR